VPLASFVLKLYTQHHCAACSGLGYCFSAALPPYLTTAATGAIDKVEREGRQLADACTANARSLRGLLSDIPGALTVIVGAGVRLQTRQVSG
jgi:7-keto-8-aminopelargonate synthetase-like enzyme